MGAACCCLRVEDFEDYVNPNSSIYRNCMCLSCFVQNFLTVNHTVVVVDYGPRNLLAPTFQYSSFQESACVSLSYTSLFRRGEVNSIPSSIQGAASLTSTTSLDDSLSDMYRSPPRPLPYDVDPRNFRLQRGVLVSRREKGSSHSHEESEPLRSDTDMDSESLITRDKWNELDDGSKEQRPRSSVKHSRAETTTGYGFIYSSSEDEDVCPTCLEEYTPENPRIMTKCSHHFHLGCIYEWMERSETCPVCGKVMVFNETT